MLINNLIKLSTYKSDFDIKVPYLLEIGLPQETDYSAIFYPVGNSIFNKNSVLDIDYRLIDGTLVNPYTRYNLNSGSKPNVSLTKEILKMIIFDDKSKRRYKVGTLSCDFGFEFELNSITNSSCDIIISASDGSKVFIHLSLYSLSDILKWSDSNPIKKFYVDLLADTFSTKDLLFNCAKQLYKVKTSSLTKNLVEISNVNK